MRNIDFLAFFIVLLLLNLLVYTHFDLMQAEKLIEALSNVEYECV